MIKSYLTLLIFLNIILMNSSQAKVKVDYEHLYNLMNNKELTTEDIVADKLVLLDIATLKLYLDSDKKSDFIEKIYDTENTNSSDKEAIKNDLDERKNRVQNKYDSLNADLKTKKKRLDDQLFDFKYIGQKYNRCYRVNKTRASKCSKITKEYEKANRRYQRAVKRYNNAFTMYETKWDNIDTSIESENREHQRFIQNLNLQHVKNKEEVINKLFLKFKKFSNNLKYETKLNEKYLRVSKDFILGENQTQKALLLGEALRDTIIGVDIINK